MRCGNDATYDSIRDFLERKFHFLRNESRFHVSKKGPKVGGVNLLKLDPEVMDLIEKADALDVRGARSYEMMQGVNKETFFGFMVCRGFSESVTGLPAKRSPFIYLHQGPGEYSFKGFKARHKRRVNGMMLAELTANDQKDRWEGHATS